MKDQHSPSDKLCRDLNTKTAVMNLAGQVIFAFNHACYVSEPQFAQAAVLTLHRSTIFNEVFK